MAVFNYLSKKTFNVFTFKYNLQIRKFKFSRFFATECKRKVGIIHTAPIQPYKNFKIFSGINLFNFLHEKRISNVYNFSSKTCKEKTKPEEPEITSSFQELLKFRKVQAECSILIEFPFKEDIPLVIALCEKFGKIKETFSYTGESNNVFFLIEFSSQESVKNVLCSCQCQNLSDSFPVFSRMIKFERKFEKGNNKSTVADPNALLKKAVPPSTSNTVTISQLIDDIYCSEKLPELDTRLRFFLCVLLKEAISGLFPYSDVIPFGSSVNGLGRQGSDLDVMLRLYPEQVSSDSELFFMNKTCIGDIRALQQRAVYSLGELFRAFLPGVRGVHKILHARMPIVKLKHKLLNLECDVSVNNMSAVYMSEILHFYGEIDARVRPLIYTVKKWAKETGLTCDMPGAWITNFSLALLVFYFLQNRPVPILPPINDAIRIEASASSPEGFHLNYIKSLDHWKEASTSNQEPLAQLLNEFLVFLGTYPFHQNHLSILTGQSTIRDVKCAIWIQYPFEENMNVSKNVSHNEMKNISSAALVTSKYLSNNMHFNVKQTMDLMSLLGVHSLKKQFSNRINVGALLVDQPVANFKRKTTVARAR